LLRDVDRFSPVAAGADLDLTAKDSLIQRVSLLGPTPTGPRVLSDVTTHPSDAHRHASVGRITAALLRTARSLGQQFAFELSGPELWSDIRRRMGALLTDFYRAGALLGETPAAAFSVRCDESTMTPNDIDNGRLIATVEFSPAIPVGLIRVRLALRDGGIVGAGATF
jgi:phage tail sheath protein FI